MNFSDYPFDQKINILYTLVIKILNEWVNVLRDDPYTLLRIILFVLITFYTIYRIWKAPPSVFEEKEKAD